MTETIGAAIAWGAARLGHLPDTSPRLEAERLLGLASRLTRPQILGWPERPLTRLDQNAFRDLLERRAAGEPFAYLSGRQGFWSLDLRVTPAVLVPRPETELLVELALTALPAEAPLRIADLGTGSGAIAAALACERPGWRIFASDRCPAALAVAAANLTSLRLTNVELVRADWLAPVAPNSLDAILTNPPYVREDDPHLTLGSLEHEPRQALVAGPDGLAAIRAIVAASGGVMRPGGLVAVEHGFDQGPAVRDLLAAVGLHGIETRLDLAGHERLSYGKMPPNAHDDSRHPGIGKPCRTGLRGGPLTPSLYPRG